MTFPIRAMSNALTAATVQVGVVSCGDDGRVCVGDLALWKVKDNRSVQRLKLVQYVMDIVEEVANKVSP
jgi:hypothetical protein